jgi:hypothetical protein
MIAPVQFAVRAEPATGQSFDCWLREELSTCGTGDTSLFRLTYLNTTIVDAEALPSVIARRLDITDPQAGFRVKEPQMLDWSKNLHELNTVAGMIIPGLREITEPEQRNLRHIYRKLYRKA